MSTSKTKVADNLPSAGSLKRASPEVSALAKRLSGLALLRPDKHATLLAQSASLPAFTAAAAKGPGKERWPVKTLEDADSSKVGAVKLGKGAPTVVAGAVPTTIEELRRMSRPADMAQVDKTSPKYQNKRAMPVEGIIWEVRCDVIEIKREADGDYHMVIQGASGETMIAESVHPEPPYISAKNPRRADMKKVRDAIDARLLKPLINAGALMMLDSYVVPTASVSRSGQQLLSAMPFKLDQTFLSDPKLPFKSQTKPTKVVIRGVGFFDRVHGQDGVALTNGIELHPVLSIRFV